MLFELCQSIVLEVRNVEISARICSKRICIFNHTLKKRNVLCLLSIQYDRPVKIHIMQMHKNPSPRLNSFD